MSASSSNIETWESGCSRSGLTRRKMYHVSGCKVCSDVPRHIRDLVYGRCIAVANDDCNMKGLLDTQCRTVIMKKVAFTIGSVTNGSRRTVV